MISRHSLFLALTAAACGLLINAPAHAQRTVTTEVKTLHEWASLTGSGGPILDPLPMAYFPIQSGNVDLSAALRSGTTTGRITVNVSGFADGDYTVSAVTASSSSTVALGTLAVSSPAWSGSGPIVFAGCMPNTPSNREITSLVTKSDVILMPPWGLSSGQVTLGGKVNPFPAGFNPFDVATISLTDSNGTVVSTGTLTPVAHGYLSEVAPLTAGSAAPGATGFAVVRANSAPLFLPMAVPEANPLSTPCLSLSGTVSLPIMIDPLPPIFFHPKTGSISIHAQGLPASDAVTLYANGTQYDTATTGTDGSLNVYAAQGPKRIIPSSIDLFSVSSVTVEDGSGNVLIDAGF